MTTIYLVNHSFDVDVEVERDDPSIRMYEGEEAMVHVADPVDVIACRDETDVEDQLDSVRNELLLRLEEDGVGIPSGLHWKKVVDHPGVSNRTVRYLRDHEDHTHVTVVVREVQL